MGSQRNFIVNRQWIIDVWGHMGREHSILVKFEINQHDEVELTSRDIDRLIVDLKLAQKELDWISKASE